MLESVIHEIEKINKEPCIVAIDGRCGAGKTTLALNLKKRLNCSVIHMDDFFLRPPQRTEQRLNEPGGNIDYERFLQEIVKPLKESKTVCYRPFNCHTLSFDQEKTVKPSKVIIVEGSYSCHPKFSDIYDVKLFMDIDAKEQLNRIEKRNGKERLNDFVKKWIPLEESCFSAFKIKEKCDICF